MLKPEVQSFNCAQYRYWFPFAGDKEGSKKCIPIFAPVVIRRDDDNTANGETIIWAQASTQHSLKSRQTQNPPEMGIFRRI